MQENVAGSIRNRFRIFNSCDVYDYISLLFITIIGVILIALSASAYNNKETQKDTQRNPLSEWMLIL